MFDEADQTKFSLPHFSTYVKGNRGNGIDVHLIGLLRHGAVNELRPSSMTDVHAFGANHVIESIHRLMNDIDDTEGGIP